MNIKRTLPIIFVLCCIARMGHTQRYEELIYNFSGESALNDEELYVYEYIVLCIDLQFPTQDIWPWYKKLRGPFLFSMVNIKTQYFNKLPVNRVFDMFANIPNVTKKYLVLQSI